MSDGPQQAALADPPGAAIERDTAAAARSRDLDPGRPWYRFAEQLLPEAPGRWIDLGCGRGELLTHHADRGIGFGLDLEPQNAASARAGSRTPRPVCVADLTRPLPFADASFDGATLVEVIEHVPNAEALVLELARILRPGAWLVLTTPNVAHLTYRIRSLTGHPPKQEGYHFRFFTRKTLAAILARGGFSLEARASFGKQALLTRLARLGGRTDKVRYRVPPSLESLLAQHFVWRLRRGDSPAIDHNDR